MKITDVKTTTMRIPFTEPLKAAYGTRKNLTVMLVEIETDEGITGYGECVGIAVPTQQTIIQTEFKPLLIGEDPMQVEFISHKLRYTIDWIEFANYAYLGVETALFDIKGKVLNAPLYELFGGLYRDTIEFIGYIHIDEPEINALQARRLVETGHRTLKVKVGRDPEEDMIRLEAIRDAVGYDVTMRIDVNMNWSVSTAIRWIRKMEKFKLQYVEQPVPRGDVRDLAAVSRAVDVPIAADESIQSLRDALQLIGHKACEVFVVYISESGGLVRTRQIVDLANEAGIACVIGTWGEAGVATAAELHLIASSRNFPFANDSAYEVQADDFITEPLQFQNGRVKVPRGPGLGLEIDRAKVKKYSEMIDEDTPFRDPDSPRFIPQAGNIL